MAQLLILFILVPLLAFLASMLWDNKHEREIGLAVRLAKSLNLLMAFGFAVWWLISGMQPVDDPLLTLYQTEHFVFALHFYYDEITVVFSITGAMLFFLVATFSKYYMHRDAGYKRFFNTILLFSTAYNFIILSGNFETLFIGWEMKGLCSFLLIAFYRDRYLPVKNAFKAVSYYRVSDVSLMIVMWMLHHLMQRNISFPELGLAREAALTAPVMAFVIVLFLIVPAAVKSAQFPFSTWLPRALEGPTSSSAIFYGSLSVHIGVFLLLRTYPFWEQMEWAKITIVVTGVLTAITSTVMARVQPTVKTQIAYASSAQIGLMFIEIALGFHWLVLLHFAGNAFLRTYQLLVSPSVLNYLVHHQIFHYTAPGTSASGRFKTTLYMLGVKEWNLDRIMYQFLWSPFKWLGRQFGFLRSGLVLAITALLALVWLTGSLLDIRIPGLSPEILAHTAMALALILILFAFSYRGPAKRAWIALMTAHIFILSAVQYNARHIPPAEIVLYASGILPAFLLGLFLLNRTEKKDQDISLSRFHGYVYETENTGLLFLFAAIGLLGFPVTAAFIGIDVLFTYIGSQQYSLMALTALCFLFLELASLRILLRIYFGPHKKMYHPVAFRNS